MASNMITQTILIDGMTCVNCENRIERKLAGTIGVQSVKVSYSNSNAIISYDPEIISIDKVEKIIEDLDYHVRKQVQKQIVKENKVDITNVISVAVIIITLFMLINRYGGSGIFNAFPIVKEGMGYGMLFVIGLLTSVHCIAMCGGICLSQCVPQTSVSGVKSKWTTLRPSILYNLGRIISYTVIGGIVGALGSVVSFSGTMKGIVQVLAGAFMVIMGLNMLNLFPWLRKFNPRMPKIFAKKIYALKKNNSPFYVGLLNGLMPCGPLQAMQLYALSTGNPFQGALSMFLFSIGTVPLMLAFGALSSLLSKKFTTKMMSISAVLVIVLGIFMFNSGASLSGIIIPSISNSTQSSNGDSNNIAKIVDGIQTVTVKLSSGRYEPITVQKGIPVKWIIQAEAKDINGCNNSIVVPKYNLQYDLKAGDNVIEFTPTESGAFAYSCWMGMIRSKIRVVDDIASSDVTDPNASGLGKSSGYKIPTDEVAVAEIKDAVQYVEISMDDKRFSPAVVVMQSGIETKWIINGKVMNSGNSVISFPKYNAQLSMREGENSITLIPDQDFDFSTSDNAFYGYVKVVEDIKDIDLKAIKREVKAYVPIIQEIEDTTGLPSCH